MLPTLPKGGLKIQREQPEGRQPVLESTMPSTRFDVRKPCAWTTKSALPIGVDNSTAQVCYPQKTRTLLGPMMKVT